MMSASPVPGIIFSVTGKTTILTFITSHIRYYQEEPDWHWWGLKKESHEILLKHRLRSFNTIYRISSSALQFLIEKHQEGWKGHHEELIPSLLYSHGFQIHDFGGTGSFVAAEDKKRFYLDSPPDKKGRLKKGTMRFRPVFSKPGSKRMKLYHPVK